MAEKQKIRTEAEVQTRQIGLAMPLCLHREFREAAAQQHLNATALLRKLVIEHLDEMRSK